jgi:hypothetical protein
MNNSQDLDSSFDTLVALIDLNDHNLQSLFAFPQETNRRQSFAMNAAFARHL